MNISIYHEQLSFLVEAMSQPNRESALVNELTTDSTPEQIKLFVDGNFDKRLDKLLGQLEFVAPAFDDFEDLVAGYICQTPPAAYDTGVSDADRFLAWLSDHRTLSFKQADYVACQRARHTVEALARQNRAAHVAFQCLCHLSRERGEEWEPDDELMIHVNPIRVWTRFETAALLGAAASPPADVLFFALDGQSTSAELEPAGRELLAELVELAPCTLSSWAAVSQSADREGLASFCRDLAEIGLVAVSR